MKSFFRKRGVFFGRKHSSNQSIVNRRDEASEGPSTTWDDEATNFSTGSTAFGDSFVLTIDWESTIMGDSKENEQLYDAYLEHADNIQRRLCTRSASHSSALESKHEFCSQPERMTNFLRSDLNQSEECKEEPRGVLNRSLLQENVQLNASITVSMPSTPLLKYGDVPKDERKMQRLAAKKQIRDLRNQLLGQDPKSVLTAKLFVRLGNAERQARRYLSAMNSYFQAAAIFRKQKRSAALAMALDLIVTSYSEAHQDCLSSEIHDHFQAKTLFQCATDAINIRKEILGPWHVDTVNALQHLARLYMNTGQVEQAAEHYLEVVELRRKIYGPTHHGTAVAAHCLGNAYFQLRDVEAAVVWYDYAVMVYNHLDVPLDNPAYAQILRDRQLLKCLETDADEGSEVSGEGLFEL